MTILRALAIATALFAAGCASVPMGTPQQDQTLKTFAASPGKAGIYVYRNEVLGAAVTMDVLLDDQPLGQTGSRTFLYAQVEPGYHRLTGKAENVSMVNFIAEPGRNYFVWQEVKMGFLYARNELKVVDEKTGQQGVLECNLAAPPK